LTLYGSGVILVLVKGNPLKGENMWKIEEYKNGDFIRTQEGSFDTLDGAAWTVEMLNEFAPEGVFFRVICGKLARAN
jgi:hypothetical protein